MGKLIALLSAGSGTVVVSVGGIYMVQNGFTRDGQDSEIISKETVKPEGETGTPSVIGPTTEEGKSITPTTDKSEGKSKASGTTAPNTQAGKGASEATEPDTDQQLSTLNVKDKEGYKCVSSLFDEQDSWFSKSDGVNDFSNFFGNPASDETSIKSCLIINWEKKTYSDNKWTGKFAWTWLFMNDNKGFVVVNTVNTGTNSPSTLTSNGSAYLLEKAMGGKWEVKYEETVETDVSTSGNDFEKYLPKAKAGSGVTVRDGDDAKYWGFIKGAGDLQNICDVDSDESCSLSVTPTSVEKEFEWTWQNGGNEKVFEWSENLDWWDKMYENSSSDLTAQFENFRGTWSQVNTSDS